MNIIAKIKGTNLTYPISAVYLTGAVVAVGISTGTIALDTGLIVLTGLTLLVFIISVRREVLKVKTLVNGQRTELLHRIDTLVDYLIAAGVELPPGERRDGATDE